MATTKPLNARQRAFVLAYTSGPTRGNATRSAEAAGYTGDDETLNVTGSRMLRNALVAAEVTRIAEATRLPAEMSAAECRELLSKHAREAKTAKDAAAVATVLGKMNGWHSSTLRHEGSEGKPIEHRVVVSIEDAVAIAKEKTT